MKLRKYNIALLPVTKSKVIIRCAQFLSKISYQYQLGEKSLPHVTLYQFKAKEDELDGIWANTCKALQTHSIHLTFKDVSAVTFDNKIFWISLLPNQRDFLHEMHQTVANTVNLAINKSYDPHMTLINTKNNSYAIMTDKFVESYSPIEDDFILSIGGCDAIGQFTTLSSS
jgi:2'-5' RNA ligase